MSRYYVSFSCIGNPTDESKCTTRWPDDVQCSIPIGGIINNNGVDTFYNLMVMESNSDTQIQNWLSLNTGKVELITKEQADVLGQTLIVPGTENIVKDSQTGLETTMIAGMFNVDDPGATWSVKVVVPVIEEVIEEPPVEEPVVEETIVETPVV